MVFRTDFSRESHIPPLLPSGFFRFPDPGWGLQPPTGSHRPIVLIDVLGFLPRVLVYRFFEISEISEDTLHGIFFGREGVGVRCVCLYHNYTFLVMEEFLQGGRKAVGWMDGATFSCGLLRSRELVIF